ncbi:hypothetical protein, partial [Marinobacter sediminum]|uniref:hypothetical protein n=1 Tax=Marinobacter sediminum TaxID=256323 RepID=UPI003565C0F5
MAIDYADLFTDIGKLVKAANDFFKPATSGGTPDYPTLLGEIRGVFGANVAETLEGLEFDFNSLRSQASNSATGIATRVDARIRHKETILDELKKGNLGMDDLLREIFRDMIEKAESIERRQCRIGLSPNQTTPHGSDPGTSPAGDPFKTTADSTGNGTLSASLVLDSVTPPNPGWPVNPRYSPTNYPAATRLSELVTHNERVVFTCVQDESTGAPEGQEVFRGETDASGASEFDWRSLNLKRGSPPGTLALGNPGSGGLATLTTVQAGLAVANMNFESFINTNQPESWVVDAGVLGTNIRAETSTANVHRGDASLRLTTAATLHQDIIPGALVASKRYLFGFYLKTVGATAGSLVVNLTSPSGEFTPPVTAPGAPPRRGTNATEGGEIDLDLTAYGTQDWVWNECWINMPTVVPDDLRINIIYTGGTGDIYIDSMGFGPVVFLGGVGYALIAGTIPFL